MLRQVLKSQWISTRAIVLVMAVLAFAIPLGSVFYGGDLTTSGPYQVSSWLSASRTVGQAIPVVALGLGVMLGMAAWAPDHSGRHVYALSLPVSRAKYVMLRFAAGSILMAIPVAALGLGAVLASAAVQLPAGVHAYPLQLTLRFALSALVMFAIFFTISVGTRRAVVLTLGAVGGIVLADVMLGAFGGDAVVVATVYEALTTWPGPLAILMGRWALFDV